MTLELVIVLSFKILSLPTIKHSFLSEIFSKKSNSIESYIQIKVKFNLVSY